MEEKKKTVFWGMEPSDCRAAEEFCEKMSREGWLLDSLAPYTASFVPCKPAERKFYVDIYPDAHIADKKKSLDTYKNEWRKSGFKLLCTNDLYFYFCSEDTKAAPPELFNKFAKYLVGSGVWRKELYSGVITLLVLLYGAFKLWSVDYSDLVTFTNVCKVGLVPVFLIPALCIFTSIILRYSRHKKRITAGEKLEATPYKIASRRWRHTFGLLIAMMAWILVAIILDACTGSPRVMLLVSPMLLVAGVTWLISTMKKRGGSRLIARIVILLTVCICIAAYAVFNYMQFGSKLPEDAYALHLSELDSAPELNEASYNHTASPIVFDHYVYIETAKDGTRANTEYFKASCKPAAELLYSLIEKKLAGVDPETYELVRDDKIITYTEVRYPAE